MISQNGNNLNYVFFFFILQLPTFKVIKVRIKIKKRNVDLCYCEKQRVGEENAEDKLKATFNFFTNLILLFFLYQRYRKLNDITLQLTLYYGVHVYQGSKLLPKVFKKHYINEIQSVFFPYKLLDLQVYSVFLMLCVLLQKWLPYELATYSNSVRSEEI